MQTINSPWQSTSNKYIDAKIQVDYTTYANYVRIFGIRVIAKRTNYYTGTATSGSGKYSISVNGENKASEATMSSITIPNDGQETIIITYSSNIDVNFNGNPSISINFNVSFRLTTEGSSLYNPSNLSYIETFTCPASTINADIISWLPMAKGQANSSAPAYNIPMSMKSSNSGYLYIQNDVDKKWYRVGTGKINANTWIVRESGNNQSAGSNPRLYSFHLDSTLNVESTSDVLDVTYTIPAPTKSYYIVVGSDRKWRVGDADTSSAFYLKRPSGLPTTYTGYSVRVGNSFSFTDDATDLYLGSTVPAANNFICPAGADYVFQGFSSNSNSYTTNVIRAGATIAANSYVNDGETIYTVFKKSAITYTINYYVDGSKIGTVKKIMTDSYFYGNGSISGGTPTYQGNRTYTPSKSGVSFAGWCVDSDAKGVDYKTLQEALDANFSGNLYAVWAYPFSITTSYGSVNYGIITVRMTDSEGNLISNRSATDVTSYGAYNFSPGTQYSISINKRDSNITGYKIITTVDGTVTSTNVRTSNSTITGVLTANTTSINIQWYDDLTFYYGASNSSSTTTSADITGWYNNEHVYNFTVPSATAGLPGSWVQGSWISANTINNINSNTITLNCNSTYTNINLHNNKIFYAYYNRQANFYYGLPNSTVNTTSTQYRIGNTYSQITAPSVSPPSNWTSFVGWRTNTTPANASYTGNSFSYTSTNSPTFYAIYSRNIIFNYYNNQDGKTQTSLVQYLNTGSSSTSSVALPLLSSSTYGWSPNGWRTDTNNIAGSITSDPSPGYGIAAPTYNAVYRRYPQFDYDANGGNSTPSSTVSSTYQYYNTNNTAATAIALTIAGAISKTGSTFQGWLDGSVNHSAGSQVQFATSWNSQNPKTLIANWGTNSYYITVVSNNETKGTITSGGGSYAYGSSYLLEAAPNTGYKFDKWQFSDGLNNNGTSNSNPYQGTMGTSGGTATAYFKGISYSIKFNANGGSGSMSNQTGLEYGVGTAINENTFTPPTGKSFIGWAISSNSGAEAVYSDGGIITSGTTTDNGIVNLYAKWGNQTYSITVSVENNIGGTVSTNKTSCEYGSSFTLTASPFTGYNFTRWTLSGGVGSGTSTSTTYNGTMGASNGTAIATFTPITSTITFNRNNGSGGTGSITATYGQAMPSITLPTRTNYKFIGYYDARTGGTQYYTASGGSAKNWDKTSNTTLYAHWEQTSNNVTLDSRGGTGGSTSVQATNGSAMPTITPPTKEGHRFLGYFDNTTGGTQYYTSSGTSARTWNKTGNQILYAHWQFVGIYVFNNGQWKKAIPYIYYNGQWRQTEAYVFYNSTWRLCGENG